MRDPDGHPILLGLDITCVVFMSAEHNHVKLLMPGILDYPTRGLYISPETLGTPNTTGPVRPSS